MPEPVITIINGVASGTNALLTLIGFILHYKDVTPETRGLLLNIEIMDQNINTAKRLRRVRSGVLDPATKWEVDQHIERAEKTLQSIGDSIEGCRHDIELRKAVSMPNKLRWLFRDNAAFLSKGTTLNNCLQALNCDITRMTMVLPATPPPPSYDSITKKAPGLILGETTRRKASRERISVVHTNDMADAPEQDLNEVKSCSSTAVYLEYWEHAPAVAVETPPIPPPKRPLSSPPSNRRRSDLI